MFLDILTGAVINRLRATTAMSIQSNRLSGFKAYYPDGKVASLASSLDVLRVLIPFLLSIFHLGWCPDISTGPQADEGYRE